MSTMAALTVGTFVHVMTPPVDVRRGLRWSGCRCGVQSAVTSAMAVRVADSWTMALSPRRRQPTDRSSSSTSSGGWPTKRWDTASILFQAVASRHVPTELAELRRSQYTAAPDASVLATAGHNVAALKTALDRGIPGPPGRTYPDELPGQPVLGGRLFGESARIEQVSRPHAGQGLRGHRAGHPIQRHQRHIALRVVRNKRLNHAAYLSALH